MQPTEVVGIQTTDDEVVIQLIDREVRIRWEQCSPILAVATTKQRQHAELSPGGCRIHRPLPDEGVSIGGLVR